MTRLGYSRYAAQGGDWGAQVTTAIGARHPGHVAGIHLNMPVVPPDRCPVRRIARHQMREECG